MPVINNMSQSIACNIVSSRLHRGISICVELLDLRFVSLERNSLACVELPVFQQSSQSSYIGLLTPLATIKYGSLAEPRWITEMGSPALHA